MPKSRKGRNQKNKATSRSTKPNLEKGERNRKTSIIVGIIAIAAVAVSAFLVLNWGLFFGGSSTTRDWSLYGGTKVRLETNMGNITIQLRTDKPITTANFLKLTNLGLYDNTAFHRVIAGFMIQGGEIANRTVSSISDEIGTANHNYNGTIAMANTGKANSASSQFFINVADNNNLYEAFDKSYTVFGRVIDGMNVVLAISKAAKDSNDRPIKDITLIKAKVIA